MVAVALLAGLTLTGAQRAAADTRPPAGTPATVSTDALPTVQIDGVVWAQAVVGDIVYAAGRFTQARPAGVAAGATGSGGRVARSNMLAYDITTGALLPGFAPSFNSEVRALAVSADGSTLYATGNFTTVNGERHVRIAAISASTGAAMPFSGSLNSIGLAVAVHGGSVYTGGAFTAASGAPRSRLAAFDAASGALRPWRPTADAAVQALVVAPDGGSVVVAGQFAHVDGSATAGSARVDATTGRTLRPWTANRLVQNSGADAAVYSLSSDADDVYLSGYAAQPARSQKRLQGVASVSWATGAVRWIEDCRGSTYATAPIGDVVYTAGAVVDCSTVHGFPRSGSIVNRALAFTRSPTQQLGRQTAARYPNFAGRAAPGLLHWLPSFTAGTFTGTGGGTWNVAGDRRYVVYGGEFTAVDGRAQQGLVRFAVAAIAPNADGPRLSGAALRPTLRITAAGRVTVTVPADWDRDNATLTYRVYRDPVAGTPLAAQTPVATVVKASTGYWDRPTVTATDTGVPSGVHTYRITVVDPFGNLATGTARTVTVP